MLQEGKEPCNANGTPSVPGDVVCLHTTYTSPSTVSHSRAVGVAAADYVSTRSSRPVVSLNRVSLGCVISPRKQSGDFPGV